MTVTIDQLKGKLYAVRILTPQHPWWCDQCDNLAEFALFRSTQRVGLACRIHLPKVEMPEERA